MLGHRAGATTASLGAQDDAQTSKWDLRDDTSNSAGTDGSGYSKYKLGTARGQVELQGSLVTSEKMELQGSEVRAVELPSPVEKGGAEENRAELP